MNIIKRHKQAAIKRANIKEISQADLRGGRAEYEEEAGDFFDRVADLGAANPEDTFLHDEASRALLAPASPDDREIVRFVAVHEWDMAAVAEHLGISAVAARQRYHRALRRLRAAHETNQARERENADE